MRIFKPIAPPWSGGYSRLPSCTPSACTPSGTPPDGTPISGSPPGGTPVLGAPTPSCLFPAATSPATPSRTHGKSSRITPAQTHLEWVACELRPSLVARPCSPVCHLTEDDFTCAHILDICDEDARLFSPKRRLLLGCRVCRSAARWLRCGRVKVHLLHKIQVNGDSGMPGYIN